MNTIGDHLKKVRLDKGLFQKQVAKEIGVDPFTILNWETGATNPKFRYLPGIIRFLGYNPSPVDANQPLSTRLKACRVQQGLSQKQAAKRLGVNESSIQKWEAGRAKPIKRLKGIIEAFLRHHPKRISEPPSEASYKQLDGK